jgi:hypothetical protein
MQATTPQHAGLHRASWDAASPRSRCRNGIADCRDGGNLSVAHVRWSAGERESGRMSSLACRFERVHLTVSAQFEPSLRHAQSKQRAIGPASIAPVCRAV